TSFCAGGSVVIAAAPGFASYSWQVDGMPLPDTTASVVADESGTFTVIVENDGGCAATDSVEVLLLNTPTADFGYEVRSVPCGPVEVLFEAAIGAGTYTWDFGDGTNASGTSQTHNYGASGTYPVALTVTNGPCSDAQVIAVAVPETEGIIGPIEVPNVFSPNGDGFNDCFAPIGLEEYGSCYGLVVFDRWGLQVFAADSPGACWKGLNDQGDVVPDGVYYYVLTLNDKEVKGHVTLLR
ncbi:MAG TPA: gliding motility-associated C-terminal domain-containing protein, partial [Flavobacteriales bacterium]|nr:gliding motility-associated C-terminal domain-containing protein [Flavobacteriales bacterium]